MLSSSVVLISSPVTWVTASFTQVAVVYLSYVTNSIQRPFVCFKVGGMWTDVCVRANTIFKYILSESGLSANNEISKNRMKPLELSTKKKGTIWCPVTFLKHKSCVFVSRIII